METPAKRRKLDGISMLYAGGYNSNDDDGDDLLDDYETVATVPLDRGLPTQGVHQYPSSPAPYITQPTQILATPQKRGLASADGSTVQVPRSSPTPASAQKPLQAPMTAPTRSLGSAMAPAGTAFRLPMVQKPTPVQDLSDDDGPVYRGGFSDDESQQPLSDIKPSKFTKSARPAAPMGQGPNKFGEIIAGSFYKPMENNRGGGASAFQGSVYDQRNRNEGPTVSRIPAAPMRSSDVMANAYGGARRNLDHPPIQQQAARHVAQPVKKFTLEDIEDANARNKVKRMNMILSSYSIKECLQALKTKRYNYDDAIDYLAMREPGSLVIDLTGSDDELTSPNTMMSQNMSSKQQVRAPAQSIQEKYAADQALAQSSKQQLKKPAQSIDEKYAKEQALKARERSSSPIAPQPPRRRIMTGHERAKMQAARTNLATPPESPAAKVDIAPQKKSTKATLEDITGSEGIAKIEKNVLKFLNECTGAKLRDNINCTDDVANEIISHKFFSDLDEIREISAAAKAGAKPRKGGKPTKNIGEKVVEKLIETFQGYAAVDVLVSVCEEFGKSVAEGMARWGVDAFGQASKGELDIVNIEKKPKEQDSQKHDSGIGTPASTDDESVKSAGHKNAGFLSQPSNMGSDVTLKDYQIVGFNWLLLLFHQKKSCILADDMGLGKTCQVVAFLAALLEQGNKGPHLVVVPGSTIENWMREFRKFCPALQVELYVGSQADRWAKQIEIKDGIDKINVLLTTYTMAKGKEDSKFLRRIDFETCIFDEGHMLKNCKSEAYKQMMRLQAKFRLLLTGTPLQNNLMELTSLLSFLNYEMFKEFEEPLNYIFSHKATTSGNDHEALLSNQRTARAKTMLTPFVLRRKKHQVLKDLPKKTRRVEYCEMTPAQQSLLDKYTAQVAQINADRLAGITIKADVKSNVLMNLRKAAIHPLLFRVHYTDKLLSKLSKDTLKIPEFHDRNLDFVYEDFCVMTDWELHNFCIRYPSLSRHSLPLPASILDSGKVSKLVSLLQEYKRNNDRVLIFSQFVLVLNLLEPILDTIPCTYFRLDGATKMDERQDMIDQFYDDPSITAFMLSTKAGGAGINLAAANKVIIFDGSFNPQDDIQAENRAHRVGQTRDVEVVRLVSKGTVEEKILRLGRAKMELDDKVAGVVKKRNDGGEEESNKDGAGAGGEVGENDDGLAMMDEKEGKKAEERGLKALEEDLFGGGGGSSTKGSI